MYLSGLWILLLALTQVNLELQGWGDLGGSSFILMFAANWAQDRNEPKVTLFRILERQFYS